MELAQSWCHIKQTPSLCTALSTHACAHCMQWKACMWSQLKVTCPCKNALCPGHSLRTALCADGSMKFAHCHFDLAVYSCGLYMNPACHVGLGNPRQGLHPVQARLAKAHGSQCGFCTPGFVMSMYSLLRSKTAAPTETEIEDNLAGNLW